MYCSAYGELESCERAVYPFQCSVHLPSQGWARMCLALAGSHQAAGTSGVTTTRRRTERIAGALRQRAARVDGRCGSRLAEYTVHGLAAAAAADDLCRTEWALGVSEVRLDMIRRRLPGM